MHIYMHLYRVNPRSLRDELGVSLTTQCFPAPFLYRYNESLLSMHVGQIEIATCCSVLFVLFVVNYVFFCVTAR